MTKIDPNTVKLIAVTVYVLCIFLMCFALVMQNNRALRRPLSFALFCIFSPIIFLIGIFIAVSKKGHTNPEGEKIIKP